MKLNVDGSFTYSPNLNYNGTDSFTYYAYDGTVNSVLTATVIIEVKPVNDAPVISNIRKSGPEDIDLVFTADFTAAYTDVEGDALQKVQINTLPANGTLLFNEAPVTTNQEIPAAELNKLVFRPTLNFNGSTRFD